MFFFLHSIRKYYDKNLIFGKYFHIKIWKIFEIFGKKIGIFIKKNIFFIKRILSDYTQGFAWFLFHSFIALNFFLHRSTSYIKQAHHISHTVKYI